MKKAISITITLLMLMSGMFGMVNESTGSENTAGISSAPGNNLLLLTSHAPIRINSNADFANQAASEGWNGSGTQAYPYIIENYDIDGATHGFCLYIGNTTVYFVVRNCSLQNASWNDEDYFWNSGLVLYNVTHGMAYNNTASSNGYSGIYIRNSTNCILRGNRMINDGISIMGDKLIQCKTHEIDTTNTVNGKPVYYWKNRTSGTVPKDAGEVILANCTGITVENLNVSNSCGIQLLFSRNNMITSNNASFTTHSGIKLLHSSSNTIVNNNASLNKYYGISLYDSSNNAVVNNTALLNGFRDPSFSSADGGILLENSSNNVVANNNVASNREFGIDLADQSENNIISKNNASSNSYYGIILWGSSNNTITDNTVFSNKYSGICLCHHSENNTLIRNEVFSNGQMGILFSSSGNNTIKRNNIFSNNWNGMSLEEGSDNNTIVENNIKLNNQGGILLYFSSGNRIYHNNFVDNKWPAYDVTGKNQWDAGYPTGGNYWSDYIGTDKDGDGIGDTPYKYIGGGGGAKDNYPLIDPWNPEHPNIPKNQLPCLLGIILILIAVIVVAIFLKRKKSLGIPAESEEGMEPTEETDEAPMEEKAEIPEEMAGEGED